MEHPRLAPDATRLPVQDSGLTAADPEAADRAMHVLAVLDTSTAPSASPAPPSDGDDTPVYSSPLTFAISEATASATIREMTRRGDPSVSPIRSRPSQLRSLTPTKLGARPAPAAAAVVPGVPLTVAADMRLVSAPAAELRRWLCEQRASGRFQEYGYLRNAAAVAGASAAARQA